MTLTDAEQKSLIDNYVEKSLATMDQVRFLIENNQLSLAVNRIYYILSASALKNSFITSKHVQLIGWFNNSRYASKNGLSIIHVAKPKKIQYKNIKIIFFL